MPVWCVLKMYSPFLITDRPFSRPEEWSSPRLERFAANRPDKATYLANHKKTGLWPWTQLSASPCTVLFRWKSVVDHVDHAVPRAPGRWSGWRWGLGRGRHGAGEDVEVEARAERSTRVHWFGCGVRLPSPQNNRGCGWVEDGLASGGSSTGRWGQRGITADHGRQEHATRPALLWAAGARRPEVEEALRPLDGHRTITAARIVYID